MKKYKMLNCENKFCVLHSPTNGCCNDGIDISVCPQKLNYDAQIIGGQLDELVSRPKFEDGVIYALARMIDLYGEPTMAYAILHESGIDVKKIKSDDAKIVKKAGNQKAKN